MRIMTWVAFVSLLLSQNAEAACEDMCLDLWTCMQSEHCPDVDPTQDGFREKCAELDDEVCAVLSDLVDPSDCETTVTTISRISPGFDRRCGQHTVPTNPPSCAARCAELWACTQADPLRCPGFSSDVESEFLEACADLDACAALDVIVDPDACSLTVDVMSTVHDKFGDNCETREGGGLFRDADGDIHIHQCGACRVGRGGGDGGHGWLAWCVGLAFMAARRRG